MMKKLIIYLLWILLLVQPVFAGTFYVSDAGSGDGSGDDSDNMASVATHNAGTGNFATLDGDTVVLCGDIDSTIRPPDGGTSGSWITYDGECSAYDATKQDVLFDGYDYGYTSFYTGNSDDYIHIKNCAFDWDYTSEMGTAIDNAWAIRIENSEHLIIENVDIQEVHNGIAIMETASDVQIIKSYLHRIAESGIYMMNWNDSPASYPTNIVIGGSEANGNTFYEITHKSAWDNNMVGYDVRASGRIVGLTCSYNHHYSETDHYGMSAYLLHGAKDVLIEHNRIHGHRAYYARPMISIKGCDSVPTTEEGCRAYNIIIRFNEIYDWDLSDDPYGSAQAAITCSGNWNNIYQYGNYLHDGWAGINMNISYQALPTGYTGSEAPTWSDDVDCENFGIWGNVFANLDDGAVLFGGQVGSADDDELRNGYVVNNTTYNVGTDTSTLSAFWTDLELDELDDIYVYNNIFHTTMPNQTGTDRFAIFTAEYTEVLLDYNNEYDSTDSYVYYDGSTTCEPCSWDSANVPGTQGDHDIGTDPHLSDPSGTPPEFKLTASSTNIIDEGTSVADTDLPSYAGLITINGKTFCNNSGGTCDEVLSFTYGLDATTTFTEGAYSPVWASRAGTWDLGAIIYAIEAGSGIKINWTTDPVVNWAENPVVNWTE